MGALPKKKISKSRGRKRFSTKTYTAPKLVTCQKCQSLKLPHVVCPTCGHYNDREVFKVKEKVKVTKIDQNESEK